MNNMEQVKVFINSVVKIKYFNELMSKYPGRHVDLVSGRYRVPANSLMGIFSLDTSKPLTLEFEDEYRDFIYEKFSQFMVD